MIFHCDQNSIVWSVIKNRIENFVTVLFPAAGKECAVSACNTIAFQVNFRLAISHWMWKNRATAALNGLLPCIGKEEPGGIKQELLVELIDTFRN
jgi:hypothetical protein